MARLASFTLLFAIALVSGCLTYPYEEYGSKAPGKYFGTQPGHHSLSDYFTVEVVKFLTTFYVLDPTTGNREQIGSASVQWFDRSDYGPREKSYAISEDGKRLIYFDEPNGCCVADLYIYDAEDQHRKLLYRDVNRNTFGCLELPQNFISFGGRLSTVTFEHFVRSTEGEEVSLDARRKRLAMSGSKDEICDGPL